MIKINMVISVFLGNADYLPIQFDYLGKAEFTIKLQQVTAIKPVWSGKPPGNRADQPVWMAGQIMFWFRYNHNRPGGIKDPFEQLPMVRNKQMESGLNDQTIGAAKVPFLNIQ